MSNDDFSVEAINNAAIPNRESIDAVDEITLDDVFNMDDDKDNDKVNSNIEEEINTDSIEDADATIIANDVQPAEKPIETGEEFIEFDDDFKNLLMNDIKSSTPTTNDGKKNEINNNDVANTDDVIKFGSTEKLEFDDSNDKLSADLITMDIRTQKYSTNAKEEIQPDDDSIEANNANEEDIEFDFDPINNNRMSYANINNVQNNSADNINSEVKINNNMENNNQTNSPNNKKTLALIISIVLLAAILIIGGIIGYLYLSQKPTHTAQNTEKEKKDDTQPKTDSVFKDTTKNIDTTKIDSIKIASNKIDTTKTDSIKVDSAKNKPNDKPNDIITPTPANRKNTDNNTTANNNNVRQRTDRPTNTSIATHKKKSNIVPVIPQSNVNAEYTVQVYSSPSREDAERRLEALSQKNINGYISNRTIKGEVWYRVRFGSYNSYEAAVNAAARYGFSNAWIERIK
jgi:cell division protein FtsN